MLCGIGCDVISRMLGLVIQRVTKSRNMVWYLARGKTGGVLYFVSQKDAEQLDQHIVVGSNVCSW